MPWRRTRDPYAVWVSEVMLQQTRVDVVVPYFERWMAAFPTVEALAAAPFERVLAQWSGLGYYQRARRLHAAAQAVARAGGLPQDHDAWLALPGVGTYTAGAVASIALGNPVAAVDGNVQRVLARWHAMQGTAAANLARIRREADRLVQASADPGTWNQALMELGAMVCTAKPRCHACPVQRDCRAFASGLASVVPRPARKARPVEEGMQAAFVARGGKVLLVRNPDEGLLAGLWMLPMSLPDEDLEDAVARLTGVEVVVGSPAARVRHAFSHRRWAIEVLRASTRETGRGPTGRGPRVPLKPQARWVPLRGLDLMALPAVTKACIEAAS